MVSKQTYCWKGTVGHTNRHGSVEAQRRKRLRRAGLYPPLEYSTLEGAVKLAGL